MKCFRSILCIKKFIQQPLIPQFRSTFVYILIVVSLLKFVNGNDSSDFLDWCLNHHSFYQDIKLCPTIHKHQPLYKVDAYDIHSNLSIRVQDENFYINDGSLHFNSTRRLVSESLAIGLWKKGEDGEADELINCLLLRLDANDKHCNFVRNCTTVISVLASISLILAMAFSISLIVIHRRKALTCRFWGKKSVDDDNCSTNCQPENNDQCFISPRKASYSPTELINGTDFRSTLEPHNGMIVPRKSSLKVSRLEVVPVKNDPLKTGNGNNSPELKDKKSFENEGYQESDSSRRNSATNCDDGQLAPEIYQGRRKSTVTFSDKTEIIRIMKLT